MVGDNSETGLLTLFAVLAGLMYTLGLSAFLPRRRLFNYRLVTVLSGALFAAIIGLIWLDRGRVPSPGTMILITCCWAITVGLWFVGLRQLSGRRTPKDHW